MLSIHCNSRVKSWRRKKEPQRLTKIKPFLNKYNWEENNYPSGNDDWKKLRKIMQQLFI